MQKTRARGQQCVGPVQSLLRNVGQLGPDSSVNQQTLNEFSAPGDKDHHIKDGVGYQTSNCASEAPSVLALRQFGILISRWILLVNALVGTAVLGNGEETKVEVVFSTTLSVHEIHKEAGKGFEDEAEDCHAGAESEEVF